VPDRARPLRWGSAPSEAAGDQLGTSVDVSGDLLVVGAPGDRVRIGRGNGSAFVFAHNELGWIERHRVRRMADTGHTQIAATVSISAGVVLVGADRDLATDSGSVFFYQ
jgi:hypothetical protein